MAGTGRWCELRRVVITGIGVVSPVGIGKEEYFSSLLAGHSGVGTITRFDTTGFPVRIAAEVKGFDPWNYMERKAAKRMERFSQYAVASAVMAKEDSGLTWDDPYSVGVFVGSGIGGLDIFYEQIEVLVKRGPDRVNPFFIPMMIPNMAAATSPSRSASAVR